MAVLDLQPSGAGDAYIGVTCDVSDGASVDAAVATAAERLGGIDIVVANAGIGAQGSVADNDDDESRRVLDVNVIGVVRTVSAPRSSACVGPRRGGRRHGVGRILVRAAQPCPVQRIEGRAVRPDARHGRRSRERGHRQRRGAGNGRHAVGGATARRPTPPPSGRRFEDAEPMGHLVSAEEVAAAICYLASPQSASTTGTVLAVDGGMYGLRLRSPS